MFQLAAFVPVTEQRADKEFPDQGQCMILYTSASQIIDALSFLY